MQMGYVRFYEEMLEVRGLKKSQTAEYIKMQTGYELTTEKVYEFLDPRREACPNACTAAIWELAFGVNLPPKYYGAETAVLRGNKKK